MLPVIHSGLHVSGQKLGGKMLDQSLMGSASVLAKIQRLLVYKLPNCYAVRKGVCWFVWIPIPCYDHKKLLDIQMLEPLSKCLSGWSIWSVHTVYIMHYLYIYHQAPVTTVERKRKLLNTKQNTDLSSSCPSHRVYGNPATPCSCLFTASCMLKLCIAISHTEAEAFSTSDLQFGSKR